MYLKMSVSQTFVHIDLTDSLYTFFKFYEVCKEVYEIQTADRASVLGARDPGFVIGGNKL